MYKNHTRITTNITELKEFYKFTSFDIIIYLYYVLQYIIYTILYYIYIFSKTKISQQTVFVNMKQNTFSHCRFTTNKSMRNGGEKPAYEKTDGERTGGGGKGKECWGSLVCCRSIAGL